MATHQTASDIGSRTAGRSAAASQRTQPRDATERMNVYAKSIAVGVLIALIGIGTFGRFYSARFNGLIAPQTIQAAEVANNVRHGRGLTTHVTYPLALKYVTPGEDGRSPSLWGAPIYPYAMSLLFRVRGAGDATVSIFNGLMLLITGWVMYAISRSLWDRTIGLFSVAVFFVSVDAIGNALTGSGVMLAALFLTVAVWAVVRGYKAAEEVGESETEGRSAIVWPVVAGASVALAWLSGLTSMLLLIPMALLAGASSRRRWRSIGAFAVAAAVVLTPWMIRNMVVAGTPVSPLSTYELISHTSDYPGMTIYQETPSEAPSPLAFAISNPMQMGSKMASSLNQVYRTGPRMFTPYLFPFLILAAFIFGRRDFRRSLWRAVIAILVLQAISLSLFSTSTQGLAVIFPVAVIIAAGTLIEALRRTNASRWAQIGIGAAVFALILFPTVTSAVLGGEMPPARSQANLGLIAEGLSDDAVVLTNDPAAVSWYANKEAVLMPETPAGLQQLEQLGLDHHYIYISRARSATIPQAALTEWMAALQSEGAESFGRPARLVHPELFLEVEAKRTVPTT